VSGGKAGRRAGAFWLLLAGLLMIAWGVVQYIGVEWWPAMLIVVGVFLVVWGILAIKGVAGFEKE